MPEKKITPEATTLRSPVRKGHNLSMNETIAARGFAVAKEFGFGASEVVEKFLELLHEERMKIGKRKRGDSLQLTLFDRVTPPAAEAKKKK